ncbi:MAG: glycosyltransferase [Planctomycetota bacterium]|nr:MAG: glycosyltransferase [Planctomycetota bacterium]
MAARGCRSALFSLDQPGTGLAPQVGHFNYSWPRSPWRRRRDFHHFHAPLAQAIEAFARELRPDLVHVQNLTAFRSTVFPTLARLGVPVVMTVHDFTLLDPNPARLERRGVTGVFKRFLDRRSLERSRREVFQSVSLFLCPTVTLRDAVGFPPGKARLLRLPITLAAAPALPPPPLRLFFAGTLYRSKGVDVLLQALAQGMGHVARANLEVAGAGDQEAELQSLAQRLGLRDRVRFLGQLDADAMDAAYRRANLQVLPSRVPENSPLTVLEAGARGRASVASHSGGVPELLAPPERGWTFASGDATALAAVLEQAASRPEELAARGARMREWVAANFDPQAHWDALAALYQELAG